MDFCIRLITLFVLLEMWDAAVNNMLDNLAG